MTKNKLPAKNQPRNILTLAIGKNLYFELAINLARSFFWWHPDTAISFTLVTDIHKDLPSDLKDKLELRYINPGEFGNGFSPKLHLDQLIKNGQNLFIDSDCLIFKNIDFVFERFKGHDVSVVGSYISDGEWFGDVNKICAQFNIPHVPKFNGGVYYLEKNQRTTAVYQKARKLEKVYDDVGLKRLRGRPNDELLMALAMQLNGQTPIADDATIFSDPQACQGDYKIDVIKGEIALCNPPYPDPKHQSWYPFEKVSPAILHFLGHHSLDYHYKKEVYRLLKAGSKKLNAMSEASAFLRVQLPGQLKNVAKMVLRPVYHLLFGLRKIKPSERL